MAQLNMLAELLKGIFVDPAVSDETRARVARRLLSGEFGPKTPAETPALAVEQSGTALPNTSALAPADSRAGSTPARSTTLGDYEMSSVEDEKTAKRIAELQREIDRGRKEKSSVAELMPLLNEYANLQAQVQAMLAKQTRAQVTFTPGAGTAVDLPSGFAESLTRERNKARPSQEYQYEMARNLIAGKGGPSRWIVSRVGVDPTSEEVRDAINDLRKWGATWNGGDYAVYGVSAARDLERNWRRGDRLVFVGAWHASDPEYFRAFGRFVQARFDDLTRPDVQVWTVAPDALPIELTVSPAPAAMTIDQRRPCTACNLPAFLHAYVPDNTQVQPSATWTCLPETRQDAAATRGTWKYVQRSTEPSWVDRYWDEQTGVRPKEKKPAQKTEAPAVLRRVTRDYGIEDE